MQNQEYKVVCVSDYNSWVATTILEKKVNELQKEGWKAQGGVSVAIAEGEYMLTQAMVKEEDKPKEIQQEPTSWIITT